jgi:CRP/FNR family cyclic AMP-dependent transcriptional regulator
MPRMIPAGLRTNRGAEDQQEEGKLSTAESNAEYYDLLAHGRMPVSIPAGEIIFQKGDPGEGMYLLREGSIDLNDGDRLLDTVEAPNLFGEMALIQHEPRSLTAVANTDVVLIEIPVRHFWLLVHETPYFAQLVMAVMAERLRRRGGST